MLLHDAVKASAGQHQSQYSKHSITLRVQFYRCTGQTCQIHKYSSNGMYASVCHSVRVHHLHSSVLSDVLMSLKYLLLSHAQGGTVLVQVLHACTRYTYPHVMICEFTVCSLLEHHHECAAAQVLRECHHCLVVGLRRLMCRQQAGAGDGLSCLVHIHCHLAAMSKNEIALALSSGKHTPLCNTSYPNLASVFL